MGLRILFPAFFVIFFALCLGYLSNYSLLELKMSNYSSEFVLRRRLTPPPLPPRTWPMKTGCRHWWRQRGDRPRPRPPTQPRSPSSPPARPARGGWAGPCRTQSIRPICIWTWDQRYRVFIDVFSRILESLPPLPRQHSAAIGCTKNYKPGVTVQWHCVESFWGLLQWCRRERGCSSIQYTFEKCYPAVLLRKLTFNARANSTFLDKIAIFACRSHKWSSWKNWTVKS